MMYVSVSTLTVQRSLHFKTFTLHLGKYGLKLKVALKRKNIYTVKIKLMPLHGWS